MVCYLFLLDSQEAQHKTAHFPPLSFDLAIEPVALAIRQNTNIKGVMISTKLPKFCYMRMISL